MNEGKKKGDKKDKKKNKKNIYYHREQKKDEAWKKEPPKDGEKRRKEVGKNTYHWCEHHMAWTVHKPTDCLLGKQQKEDQKKKPQKANSAIFAAAAATAVNPQFAALMASIADLDKLRCGPAWMWIFMMLAFMAGPTIHLEHQVAYLQIFIMPYLLQFLFQAAYPTDPMICKTTYNVFIRKSPWRWPIRGRRTHSVPKRLRRKKKPSVHLQTESTIKAKLRTYLVPVAVSIYKVGCCVEGQLRELLASHCLRELPSISQPTFTTLSSMVDRTRAVCFDSDSYPIRIDTHASRCMVNTPHLFEDLNLEMWGR